MNKTSKLKAMNTDRMCRNPPTLTLIVLPNQEYAITLQQTKMVYDQLLADKHSKLYQSLMIKKSQYDAKCAELAQTDQDKALEFGVRAQEDLNKLCQEYSEELMDQRRDYQEKMNKMYSATEEKWKADQERENGNGVQCKVYPHK